MASGGGMPWAAARITPSPGRSRLGRESPPAKPSKNRRGRFRCPGVAKCVSGGAAIVCASELRCDGEYATSLGQDLNFITAVAELRRFGQAHSLVQQTRASSNPTVFGKQKLTTADAPWGTARARAFDALPLPHRCGTARVVRISLDDDRANDVLPLPR